jgi:hypothetical protein
MIIEETVGMFRKQQLFIALMLVLVITGQACSLLSKKSRDAKAVKTAVGTPNGTAITKSIGPAGGTIATSDGRLSLTIPQNAVSSTLSFTVQSITNESPGGLGQAYRLQPDGLTFNAPVSVSFHYDDQDLSGTIPQTLAIAYQDSEGLWRAYNSEHLDQANRTLTVSTTHFTDFGIASGMRISLQPESSLILVKKSRFITLQECLAVKASVIEYRFESTCEPRDPDGEVWAVDGVPGGNATVGTIVGSRYGATYTAPARKPTPNVVKVSVKVKDVTIYEFDNLQFHSRQITQIFDSKITIVDRGYSARGKIFDTVLSGDICDLEKRFIIKTSGTFNTDFECIPSSPTSGKCAVSEKNGITGGGGGPYTIVGIDTDKPRMELNFSGKATIEGAGTSPGGGLIHIDLVPLDKECKP